MSECEHKKSLMLEAYLITTEGHLVTADSDPLEWTQAFQDNTTKCVFKARCLACQAVFLKEEEEDEKENYEKFS